MRKLRTFKRWRCIIRRRQGERERERERERLLLSKKQKDRKTGGWTDRKTETVSTDL